MSAYSKGKVPGCEGSQNSCLVAGAGVCQAGSVGAGAGEVCGCGTGDASDGQLAADANSVFTSLAR